MHRPKPQTPGTHADRVYAYLEAMTLLWRQLSAAEQAAFLAWRAQPGSVRDSDWPGWIQYLGPRPVRQNLSLLRRCI